MCIRDRAATTNARRRGLKRREFLVSACGAATALLGMNSAYARAGRTGGWFDVPQLAALEPEIVLLGTGSRLRFPHPRLTAALARARIGLEVMDVQAACRTYNILAGEGRHVLAALLLEYP